MTPRNGISIVIPSAGRASLHATLASLKDQIGREDQVLVVTDPEVASVAGIVADSGVSAAVLYDLAPGPRDWGYKARTLGIHSATCPWIHIIGDDDVYLPGALDRMRQYCGEQAPVMFRMRRGAGCDDVLWRVPELYCGNVAGEMLFFPNCPSKFGVFTDHYAGDWDFASVLVANYGGRLRWSDTEICLWRAGAESATAQEVPWQDRNTRPEGPGAGVMPLVLTGSVTANSPVSRCDPEVRLCDYRAALFMWIADSPFSTIVYADASSDTRVCMDEHFRLAEMRGKTLIARAYDLADVSREFGKGRAEAMLLRYILEEFRWAEFTKSTGRLFVCNSGRLVQELGRVKFSAWIRDDGVDTRFFRFSTHLFETLLYPVEGAINDCNETTYIESVWGRVVRQRTAMSWWEEAPKIVGVGAT